MKVYSAVAATLLAASAHAQTGASGGAIGEPTSIVASDKSSVPDASGTSDASDTSDASSDSSSLSASGSETSSDSDSSSGSKSKSDSGSSGASVTAPSMGLAAIALFAAASYF
ncbi:hypothetical protein GGF43_003029 [Coemansia sp. RSA 2618]|nr:hypothetical protein GGF43_003029 [Coemansia sp. RSA 2618]